MTYELSNGTRVTKQQITDAYNAGNLYMIYGYGINKTNKCGVHIGEPWDDRIDNSINMSEKTWCILADNLNNALYQSRVPNWAL